FHSARNKFEKSEAFRIRKKIFVTEQGLFDTSDMDEHDSNSIHLVARQNKKIIGTVRIYKEKEKTDHWIGGRLAIEKKFRNTNAGSGLVKEAMKRVKKRGCKNFTAHIQKKNIPFFLQLGWTPLGPVKTHFGHPHQKMEADLNTVPEDMQI
ncbi:MAG: GNAT family N-acetyltransferase, partial [Desulfobacula sp.]|nr:GNAT family N-acetyltransferase [Desulfobacula sp.]